MKNTTDELIERFFRYVAVPSESNDTVATVPSTSGQHDLAVLLQHDLATLNLVDIHLDEHCNLTARLPGNRNGAPRIGFVAHLDTVNVNLSPEIHPQILSFNGEDLCLNKERDIWLRVAEHPELLPYKGQNIICTDGTSVLGADNKAAIAVIMTMLHRLQEEQLSHGDISVAFVPDEEIGLRGSKLLDLKRFDVDFAYTIDCCGIGEVVYETFNAGSARIHITGVTAHPMSAKGVLVNPLLVATDIINTFDRKDTPEHTDGKEGFFMFTGLTANASTAVLNMNIRDFDRDCYEARKQYINDTLEFIRHKHKRAHIEWVIEDVYRNISESLGDGCRALDLIYEAFNELNIPARTLAMRGGTDGSALAPRGVPTPNYFTGAHNFHAYSEFLPIQSFAASLAVTMKILELAQHQSLSTDCTKSNI